MKRDSQRSNWTGYAEGRRYVASGRDLAREVRALARRLAWAETGPLSGPRIGLHDQAKGIHFEVEVRPDEAGVWVLVRSRIANPLVVVDMFSAPAVARLFLALEREVLEVSGPDARAVLPAGAEDWPAQVGVLVGGDGRPPHTRFARHIPRLPLAVASVVFAWAWCVPYLAGRGLGEALFPGVFQAGAIALAAGAVTLAITAAVYAVMPPVMASGRRLRTDPLLRGEVQPKRGFRQAVEVEPGGSESDPQLDEARVRWLTIPRILRNSVSESRTAGPVLWVLAVLVFLPLAALLSPLRWLLESVVPAGVAGATASLAADVLSQVLALALAMPLLGGAIALRHARRLTGAPGGVAQVLVAAFPRLPGFLWAQACVTGGTLAGLVAAAALTFLLPLLAPIWWVAALVAIGWWNAVHALTGPIAFLEPGQSPLARSRFLTRGLRGWAGLLLLGAVALAGLARGAVDVVYTALVWRNPLVNWLPDGLMGLGQTLIALLFAALLARVLVDAYFNARCLREGLDLRLARGAELLPTAPEQVLSPRAAWVASTLVVVGAVFAHEQYGAAPLEAADPRPAEEADTSWEQHYRDAQQLESVQMLDDLRNDILGY